MFAFTEIVFLEEFTFGVVESVEPAQDNIIEIEKNSNIKRIISGTF